MSVAHPHRMACRLRMRSLTDCSLDCTAACNSSRCACSSSSSMSVCTITPRQWEPSLLQPTLRHDAEPGPHRPNNVLRLPCDIAKACPGAAPDPLVAAASRQNAGRYMLQGGTRGGGPQRVRAPARTPGPARRMPARRGPALRGLRLRRHARQAARAGSCARIHRPMPHHAAACCRQCEARARRQLQAGRRDPDAQNTLNSGEGSASAAWTCVEPAPG